MDKIICVGKNYLEHARELGDAIPEKPVLFLKPPSVCKQYSEGLAALESTLPHERGEVHHECEIVVRIKKAGFRLSHDEASNAIDALTLGLDLTLRDVQARLKKAGHPWEISKVFPGSALIGPWRSWSDFESLKREPFAFSVNDQKRQEGRVSEMSLDPAACVAYASEFFALMPGDLVFTGTPKGVGPLRSGDRCRLTWGRAIDFEVHFS